MAEFIPELIGANFENPRLMREFGLILENQDGFDNLATDFNMRGVPHTLALPTSVGVASDRTGWAGDGAPDPGTLRAFATGAVRQHFPKTTNRTPGVDFRFPTSEELDALEAFQLSLGRQQDLVFPLPLKGTVASRGQEIFRDNSLGKCNICHFNAGATFQFGGGNLNFDTGVENLPDQPADLTAELVPPDDGRGSNPGDGTFNTPSLVEAADTGPFFHNNAIETIEGAVAFYNGDAFNGSPANIGPPPLGGISLDGTQVVAVAAFLRVINALENIRLSLDLFEDGSATAFVQAKFEIQDAIFVLRGGGLHSDAVIDLKQALDIIGQVSGNAVPRGLVKKARDVLEQARADMIE